MSAPAALAEAYVRCQDAHDALAAALNTPDEAAARASAANARAHADALAATALRDALAYHHATIPPSPAFEDLVSAMHRPAFAQLAELSDAVHNLPDGLMLALRRAWRTYHHLPVDCRGRLDAVGVARLFGCRMFGELAFVLDDEYAVSDDQFCLFRLVWRVFPGIGRRAIPEDANTPYSPLAPGPHDPLSPPPAYRTPSPVAGPSRLDVITFLFYPHSTFQGSFEYGDQSGRKERNGAKWSGEHTHTGWTSCWGTPRRWSVGFEQYRLARAKASSNSEMLGVRLGVLGRYAHRQAAQRMRERGRMPLGWGVGAHPVIGRRADIRRTEECHHPFLLERARREVGDHSSQRDEVLSDSEVRQSGGGAGSSLRAGRRPRRAGRSAQVFRTLHRVRRRARKKGLSWWEAGIGNRRTDAVSQKQAGGAGNRSLTTLGELRHRQQVRHRGPWSHFPSTPVLVCFTSVQILRPPPSAGSAVTLARRTFPSSSANAFRAPAREKHSPVRARCDPDAARPPPRGTLAAPREPASAVSPTPRERPQERRADAWCARVSRGHLRSDGTAADGERKGARGLEDACELRGALGLLVARVGRGGRDIAPE
ncbi:hypothetical protein DFH07DRAFT_777144 [Mycena maculata]|uniref:Uncharacterized protein n=1 Tax=Mycena maculata TaxID=230809 RepID=A0AAD7ILL0_9AGAR|nr:hypothetical protein DFH07DRAFT_777144 [Mycena maculata]